MKTINNLIKKTKEKDVTIILPEANLDNRVKKAAEQIIKKKLCKIIVFGKTDEFSKIFKDSDYCEIIDIDTYPKIKTLTTKLLKLRKDKGLTQIEAEKLIKKPNYFATMLVKTNKADGIVAGAHFTTAEVLKPALQIIKTKKGKSIATGSMIMQKNKNLFLFGDVSLIEQPSSEILSEIALSNAEFMNNVLGVEPKVAMLSYSTKGSAKSEMVDKVRSATFLAKIHSKFKIDGEMQADSALNFTVAKKKSIEPPVGGNANVLIFPDLNAGNIGYKLVSQLGGYSAIGPIILNLNKPVNDLSRGCTVKEIIETVLITKLQV